MKNLFLWFCLFVLVSSASAQPIAHKALSVGDQMPDISFESIRNYPGGNLRMSDLKGKVVLLDFWSMSCSSCIAAFPKMESLQNQFEDDLAVILINPHEKEEYVEQRSQRMPQYKPGLGLSTLPSVIGDTLWKTLFPHRTVPHHVWIDQEGRVAAITHGHNGTPENVRKLIVGYSLELSIKDDFSLGDYHARDGLVRPTHPDIRPFFVSTLTRYLPNSGSGSSMRTDSLAGTFRQSYYYATIPSLFRNAYYARQSTASFRYLVTSEQRDRMFPPEDLNLLDSWVSENIYSYELTTPLLSEEKRRLLMQQDLNMYFGQLFGIKAGMEERKVWCYVVVLKDKGKLLPSEPNRPSISRITDSAFIFEQVSYPVIFNRLERWANGEDDATPLLDESGLTGAGQIYTSMTLPLNKALKNATEEVRMKAIRDALQVYGLDLVKRKRKLNFLVISDL